MDLGTTLRTARERAGVSLPDLAARTRIPLKYLRAIEENDFVVVPPGVFVRSYIRTYAREVGVDPAEAIAEYKTMTEPAVEPVPDTTPESPMDDDLRPSPFEPELESRPGWGYALIAAALLIAVISMNRDDVPERADAMARPAAAPVAATVPAERDVPAQPVPTAGTGVRIELRADGLCWVRAVADGQEVVSRLLQRGEAQTISAEHDVILRVGDPAALSYSINGTPGPPLGTAEVPVTVRVAANGQLTPVS